MVSMFDLDQTFSPNILLYEQMFHRIATSANEACASGRRRNLGNVDVFFSAVLRKSFMWVHFVRQW